MAAAGRDALRRPDAACRATPPPGDYGTPPLCAADAAAKSRGQTLMLYQVDLRPAAVGAEAVIGNGLKKNAGADHAPASSVWRRGAINSAPAQLVARRAPTGAGKLAKRSRRAGRRPPDRREPRPDRGLRSRATLSSGCRPGERLRSVEVRAGPAAGASARRARSPRSGRVRADAGRHRVDAARQPHEVEDALAVELPALVLEALLQALVGLKLSTCCRRSPCAQNSMSVSLGCSSR